MKTVVTIIGAVVLLPVVVPVGIITAIVKSAYESAKLVWNAVKF